MNLTIIGASGGVGKQAVIQALAQGHRVTAFSRHPEALGIQHANLTLAAGDARQPGALTQAVQGADAVLFTLGAPARSQDQPRTEATRHLLAAMQAADVDRLICLSSLGFGDSRPLLPWFIQYLIVPLFLKHAFADHESQEALIKASPLNYTIVRPGSLKDGETTGAYQHGFPFDRYGVRIRPISRADVAEFMLRQLQDSSYQRQTVGISM
ncbi:MAG: SDR family oxidoreductase [Bacteroidia bacterium]|nr:SDR family oxidoreductase [Bacteroidia bacterium]